MLPKLCYQQPPSSNDPQRLTSNRNNVSLPSKATLNHKTPHKPSATIQYHSEKSQNDPKPTTANNKASTMTQYHQQKSHNNPQLPTTTIKPCTTSHYHPGKSHNIPQGPNTTIRPSTMAHCHWRYLDATLTGASYYVILLLHS